MYPNSLMTNAQHSAEIIRLILNGLSIDEALANIDTYWLVDYLITNYSTVKYLEVLSEVVKKSVNKLWDHRCINLITKAVESKAWKCVEIILTVRKIYLPPYAFHLALLRACQDTESGKVAELLLSMENRLDEENPFLALNGDKKNCLELAIEYNNHFAVEAIIKYDRKKNPKKFYFPYATFLHKAIETFRSNEIIIALLSAQPDLKKTYGTFKGNYLHTAVRANNAEVIATLFTHFTSKPDREYLHTARELNVLRGFQLGSIPRGETPLQLALRHRDFNEEVYRALLKISEKLDNPIDIISKMIMSDAVDNISQHLRLHHNGKLPIAPLNMDYRWLHFALKSDRQDLADLLPMLIQQGASCASRSRNDKTAAEYAAEQGKTDALIAMVNAVDGKNPHDNGFYKALTTMVEATEIPRESKKQALSANIIYKSAPRAFIFSIVLTNDHNLVTWFVGNYLKDFCFTFSEEMNILKYAIHNKYWESLKALISSVEFIDSEILLKAFEANASEEIISAFIDRHVLVLEGHEKMIPHIIIKNKRYDLITILKKHYNHYLGVVDDQKMTPLEVACQNSYWEFLKHFEVSGEALNKLFCAALENDAPENIVNLLLKAKPSLSLAHYKKDKSPLDIIARKGRLDVLPHFLKHGSWLWYDPPISTPCRAAAKNGQWGWVREVIASKVLETINKKLAAEEYRYLLFKAIRSQASYHDVESLIFAGANITSVLSNIYYNTLVHEAIIHQRFDLVLLLIDHAPSLINIINLNGETPHDLAKKTKNSYHDGRIYNYAKEALNGNYAILLHGIGNTKFIDQQICKYANALAGFLKNNNGTLNDILSCIDKKVLDTELPWFHMLLASSHPQRKQIMALFIKYGANPFKLYKKEQPAQAIAKNKAWDLFQILISSEAFQRKYKETHALYIAIKNNAPPEIICPLLKEEYVSWRNKTNNTFVHLAVGNMSEGETLTHIINLYTENCLVPNKEGKTALDLAVVNKKWACVKQIIEIAAQEKNWQDVLECAKKITKAPSPELQAFFQKEILPGLIKTAEAEEDPIVAKTLKQYRPKISVLKDSLFKDKPVYPADSQYKEQRLKEIEAEKDSLFDAGELFQI